jgi:MFS family permease
MTESRKVSTVERVLAAVFGGKTIIALFLPFATVYFRGCKGGPARPPEVFTGWQLLPHNIMLFALPLVAAIALACAVLNPRLRNVLFALFWSAVNIILAAIALSALANGLLQGYHGDAADPWVGFWLALAGVGGIFSLWWFNLLANIGPFQEFWKERRSGKVRGKLLTSVVIGDWVAGIAIPAAGIALTVNGVTGSQRLTLLDITSIASSVFIGAGIAVLLFALKFGLRRGQAWAAFCHIAVSVVFSAIAVLILAAMGWLKDNNTPVFVTFAAIAAWFAYTILAIILCRGTFRRVPLQPPAQEGRPPISPA